MLPVGPLLVDGSFFTEVSWVLRGSSGRAYGVSSVADQLGFDVFDLGPALMLPWPRPPVRIESKRSVWTEWWQDRIRVYLKQSTIFVRANGWEVNVTRKPIYLHVSGPSRWRFDIAVRVLDGTTGFEGKHGETSATCVAHGLIGQSFDGDDVAVSGRVDEYVYPDKLHPVVKTLAQAEGAIEGVAEDYAVKSRFHAAFKFGRFSATPVDACAVRNVSLMALPASWRLPMSPRCFSASHSFSAFSTTAFDVERDVNKPKQLASRCAQVARPAEAANG